MRLRIRAGAPQQGSILVLAAALMLILIGFVGLVVDGGELTAVARSAQNAADGGALAAGYYIVNQGDSIANAQSLGQAIASQNGINGATELTLTFLDGAGAVTAVPNNVRFVQADVAHSFPTLFLPIIGIDSAAISSHARVQVTPPTGGCAVCVMGLAGTDLQVTGSGLWVQNGPIAINSISAGALTVSSGFVYDSGGVTPAISILTPGTGVGCGGFGCNPAPTGTLSISDPLVGLPQPGNVVAAKGSYLSGNTGNPQTILPGQYTSINLAGSDQVTMSPGLYVITGSFADGGSGKLIGTGVTLFFACAAYPTPCNPGQAGGSFSYSGTNQITLTGQAGGDLQGMAIFFDRNNTSAFSITSSSWFSISGTVYAPNQNLVINSSSGTAILVYARLVVKTLAVTSNAILYVQYQGNTNYTVPGTLKLVT